MKLTALKTLAFGLTLAASHALAGPATPLSELSRYNDPMGSAAPPAVVAFPASGGQTTSSFKAKPLSEISRYNDPVGSGAPAVLERPSTELSADESLRLSRFWRWTSRNQPIAVN